MPVHGINDYTVPEEAEDYRHLKAIKHDFDGFLLKEAFVMSAQKQRITAIISIITIVLMTIIGFVLPIIYLSNNKVISNGDDIHTLCGVLAVMCMIGTFLAVTFLIVRFPIFWVCNQFKRGYSAYLEGYLAVLTVMEDHYWGMDSPATVDLGIIAELGSRASFSKYANDAALNEVWTYGMYHALKFFLPSRPEDIVAVLRDALTTDDAHRDEDIFGWEMNCVDSLIKVHQMFMTKNRIYAKRYKFYRSIYPNGCDGNGPNTNADEIKIYVDSDGEIYRYKTEDELNKIKQKGEIKMNMSKLPDYKTYAKHDWDIKKAQAAFFPKSPNLWFVHICDSVVSPVSIRMIPMFMIFTLSLGLSIATTWCVIDMIFTDNTKLNLWFMVASVLSICLTKFVHKVGRRLYQRQKVSFGYFWYLVGFSAYLNLRKEENFDDNVIDLENDDNAIDYTEDELESAQVMVDMGICTGTRFGLPHTPKEIMEILVQNDDRYFDRGDTIIADLQPIFDQVENEFILDIDKIRAAGEEAYEQFIKDLKNGKATPEHSCIMMG